MHACIHTHTARVRQSVHILILAVYTLYHDEAVLHSIHIQTHHAHAHEPTTEYNFHASALHPNNWNKANSFCLKELPDVGNFCYNI